MKANVLNPAFYCFLMVPVYCLSQQTQASGGKEMMYAPLLPENIPGNNLISNNQLPVTNFKANDHPLPEAKLFDVLITEMMPDPDPVVRLPENEYIELFNRSGSEINMLSWTLKVGKDVFKIPQVHLHADSFLLITSRNGCSALSKKTLCLELLPRYCLNNDGENVGLYDPRGELIHWVCYDNSFYGDDNKDAGGWSIEMADVDNPCVTDNNWKASLSETGGTPGAPNSVAGEVPDTHSFQFRHLYLPNESTVRVYFSKPVLKLKESMFAIDQGKGSPVKLVADSIRHQYVDLVYNSRFLSIPYILEFSEEICDCGGTPLEAPYSIDLSTPGAVLAGDILINEVLFDALPGGQEFVELYNYSGKFLNSTDIKIGYRSPLSDYKKKLDIGEYPFLIPPQSFVVLAKNAKTFREFYHLPEEAPVVTVRSIPTMNNEAGCVSMWDKDDTILEEFCYSEKMHASLLSDKSGVSLERLSYTSASNNLSNWQSAASAAGFSTPGAINSQLSSDDRHNEVSLQYEIFTPDNDGNKDEEIVIYTLDNPGYMASIIIFDATGRKVRTIANNELVGTHGAFTWNGLNEDGRPAPVGIYLFYIVLHHPSGDLLHYRETCVLGRH